MHRLFRDISKSANEGLYGVVLTGVARERQRLARIRFAISGFAFLGSVGLLSFATSYAYSAFTTSSFLQSLDLLVSDTDVAALFWREFALSLVESFPVVATAMLLAAFFVLLLSLRSTLINLRPALRIAV